MIKLAFKHLTKILILKVHLINLLLKVKIENIKISIMKVLHNQIFKNPIKDKTKLIHFKRILYQTNYNQSYKIQI